MAKNRNTLDWESVELGTVLERIRKPVDIDNSAFYREIGIRSHGKGIFHKEKRTGESIGTKSVFWVEPDCLILNIVFAWEQAVAKTTPRENGMIASHRFPMYKPLRGKLDLDYLVYFFCSPRGKHMLGLASPGGAGRNKTLGQEEFSKLSIPVPPISEQRKIAEILSTVDESITKTESLITALHEQKRGLMQKVLLIDPHKHSPSCRLNGFSGDWQIKRLGDVFSRVTRKNNKGNKNVLTASAQLGLVNQLDFFNKNIAGKSLTNYYLLEKGEFAYNRGRSNGYPFGAIKRLELYEEGVLSTLYICFGLRDTNNSGNFFKHYFESGVLNLGLYEITQEGARHHGLLNIAIPDFFDLSIPVPELEEQEAIAIFFDLINERIELTQKELITLKKQKMGLVQELLTGQIRVKV